jgi:predicted nucleic acid-binding protein
VLIAVDSNVLIDQADGSADVLDALAVIRERLVRVGFIVPPTVLQELAFIADEGDTAEEKQLAVTVLSSLQEWGYEPLNVVPVGQGIVEQISLTLRMRSIVADEEEKDATIIAESALLGCDILLSSDVHLLDAQEHPAFRRVLEDANVEGDKIIIARPRDLVKKFFRRR